MISDNKTILKNSLHYQEKKTVRRLVVL